MSRPMTTAGRAFGRWRRGTGIWAAVWLLGSGILPETGVASAVEWCHQKPEAEAQQSCIRSCVDAGGESQACVAACPLAYEESCTAACEHPYPCGDEWPAELEGPFALKEVLHELVPSHDGVKLEVWVGLPDLPDGVRAPVLLTIAPYFNWCAPAGCTPDPDDPGWWNDQKLSAGQVAGIWPVNLSGGIPPIRHVRAGYAMAYLAVRGTSQSEGCFDAVGRKQQMDSAVVIEWLATRPWSNGRVGLMGLSYPAFYAQHAQADALPALKSVAVGGLVTDWWQLWSSPGGAVKQGASVYYPTGFGHGPLVPPAPDAGETSSWLTGPGPGHWCPETLDAGYVQYFNGQFGADRNEAFWTERRSLDRLHDATAATLNVHGNLDTSPGHAFQIDTLWPVLADTPQRWLAGVWAHEWPNGDVIPGGPEIAGPPEWADRDYERILFAWHDFWLKGIGPVPEHLDHVDYQDPATGAWKQTSAWPPAEVRTEVLYLTGETLSTTPAAGTRELLTLDPTSTDYVTDGYVGLYLGSGVAGTWSALCPDLLNPGDAFGIAWVTEPVADDALVAGNPMLDLTVTSNLPGGEVTAFLVDLHPDFRCGTDQRPTGYEEIGAGAIDFRFREGNWIAEDFPTGEKTRVRIDLHHTIRTLRSGHRLAVVLTSGAGWMSAPPYYPVVEILAEPEVGSSHLVLPVVEGTLGGSDPGLVYLPRPFAPVP